MPACQVLPSGNLIPHSYATWELRLRGKDKINFLKMRWSSDKPLLLKSQSTVCHRMYISVQCTEKECRLGMEKFSIQTLLFKFQSIHLCQNVFVLKWYFMCGHISQISKGKLKTQIFLSFQNGPTCILCGNTILKWFTPSIKREQADDKISLVALN